MLHTMETNRVMICGLSKISTAALISQKLNVYLRCCPLWIIIITSLLPFNVLDNLRVEIKWTNCGNNIFSVIGLGYLNSGVMGTCVKGIQLPQIISHISSSLGIP